MTSPLERISRKYVEYRPEKITQPPQEGPSQGVFSARDYAQKVARMLRRNLHEQVKIERSGKDEYIVHWILDKESQRNPEDHVPVMQWASDRARQQLGRELFALEAVLNQRPHTEIKVFSPRKRLSGILHTTVSLGVKFCGTGEQKPEFTFVPIPRARRSKKAQKTGGTPTP